MTFLLGLWANPLARKAIIYGAIAIGILYGLRIWGNRQWQKGEIQGRQTMARDLEKQKQKEWDAREAAIKEQASSLAEAKTAIQTQTEQLAQDRNNLSRSLADARAQLQRERTNGYANAAGIPDSRIWDDLRTASRELAADDQ
jgi:hypothetical protein